MIDIREHGIGVGKRNPFLVVGGNNLLELRNCYATEKYFYVDEYSGVSSGYVKKYDRDFNLIATLTLKGEKYFRDDFLINTDAGRMTKIRLDDFSTISSVFVGDEITGLSFDYDGGITISTFRSGSTVRRYTQKYNSSLAVLPGTPTRNMEDVLSGLESDNTFFYDFYNGGGAIVKRKFPEGTEILRINALGAFLTTTSTPQYIFALRRTTSSATFEKINAATGTVEVLETFPVAKFLALANFFHGVSAVVGNKVLFFSHAFPGLKIYDVAGRELSYHPEINNRIVNTTVKGNMISAVHAREVDKYGYFFTLKII
ncbi:hypothetical protein NCCP2716_27920 [Sporosarcina sp. NCCP-2716]|uniref:hypothetical protein n=1 Tax=Sporosarcina sp. NCCP-2716 TaxID=2943679 RepID=UPI00203AF4B3|nr:hypothetical protein [Sporosarcina sp. NCCP-2716]GKV70294.1 hypothetical protein NCCP2716_27920 [Sporosarcina sp. NCCP-2716]